MKNKAMKLVEKSGLLFGAVSAKNFNFFLNKKMNGEIEFWPLTTNHPIFTNPEEYNAREIN